MPYLNKYFLESSQNYPERIALKSHELSLTYRELALRVDRLAEELILQGLERGDRVLLLLQDKIDLLVALIAVMHAGGIAVPVRESFTAEAFDRAANDCHPLTAVSHRKQLIAFPALGDKMNCRVIFIEEIDLEAGETTAVAGDVHVQFGGASDRRSKQMNVTVADGALLLYDGSNGQAGGRLFTHKNLLHFTFHSDDGMPHGSECCELMLLPPSDVVAFSRIQSLLYAGGTAVLHNASPTPISFIQQILDEGCDAVTADVGLLMPLIKKTEALLVHFGGKLRRLELFGDSPSLQQKRKLIELFPKALIRFHYGSAEAPQSTILELPNDRRKLDTVGRPGGRVEISIRD